MSLLNMKKTFFTILLVVTVLSSVGQKKFIIEQLKHPNKYGEQVKSMFQVIEIPEFIVDSTKENTIYLENGLRQHDFKNVNEWFDAKNEIDTIKEINIVFSKYPVRDGVYTMLIPLLFNRLQELFELDPELNDAHIRWKITLQTNCPSDAATMKLFHGIEINYIPYCDCEDEEETESEENDKTEVNKKRFKRSTEGYMNELYDLPDELKDKIEISESRLEKEKLIIKYLEDKVKNGDKDTSINNDKDKLKKFTRKLKYYEDIHTYGDKDSTILKVFERNKQWENALVVCDWTGSMYAYGGQLLLWHLANKDTSSLKYLTLFNDGDDKRLSEKKIGTTGGIYHASMSHIETVFDLYNLVMLKGYGGDGPENDIEAILKALENFKHAKPTDIILIADNSCVRDIELLSKIKVPVHVVLCGYYPNKEINPQYFDIATKTNGSLHTLEFDLNTKYYNSLKPNQAVKFLRDSLGMIEYSFCDGTLPRYTRTFKFRNTIDTTSYSNIDSAFEAKSANKVLNLSSKNLTRLSRKIFRIVSLMALDVSENNIKRIPGNISSANRLTMLNLEENDIDKIPDQICLLRNIKNLNLSNNNIDDLPEKFSYLRLLEYLDLSNNKLSSLPRRFYFSKMKTLSLRNNEISDLPYFGGMKKLKILDLSNNKLKSLPNSISRLKSLEVLDLSNNTLQELPRHISRLKKLQKLVLIGNPITDEELNRIENLFPNLQIEI